MLAAVAAAAVATFGLWGVAAPANADIPTTPAEEFVAPLCVGTTLDDPTDAPGPVSNLATVFGARLDAFNEGRVVPLYDVFGSNDNNGYPAVCATRYVAGEGAVSEWMFCTDYFSHVCSGVDAEGNLLDFDGNPIPGMDALPGANPKLTPDQEKLIAYLIQHGRDTYNGTGGFSMDNATKAVVDGDSWERAALQVLIWCISDPVGPLPSPISGEADRAATCEDNMNAETQAELLAALPDDPTLTVTGPATSLDIGATAEFSITTDVFTSPLAVTTGGVAGTLSVISGPGVLTGSELQVTGTTAPVTVVLGLTATGEGTADLAVQATPASTSHIEWNQSPGLAADQRPCQVFATFHVADQVLLDGAASATFATEDDADDDADASAGVDGDADAGADSGDDADAGAGAGGTADAAAAGSSASADGTSGATDPEQGSLAATGAEPVAPIVLIAALAAAAGGALIVVRARRRQTLSVED